MKYQIKQSVALGDRKWYVMFLEPFDTWKWVATAPTYRLAQSYQASHRDVTLQSMRDKKRKAELAKERGEA